MTHDVSPRPLIARLRQHLIWWLIGAYALAALAPELGHTIRRFSLGEMPFSGGGLNPTHLLLGILLFCVGLGIRPNDAREIWRIRSSIAWGVLGSWLVPITALGILALIGPTILNASIWGTFLIGAAVVVAMPPAHSSSIWSQLSGGPAAATLSVIVLGSLASPLLTPVILGLVSSSADAIQLNSRELIESLEVLLAFVVLPAAVGLALRMLLDGWFGDRRSPWLQLSQTVSLGALVLLNYVNASAAHIRLLAEQTPWESLIVLLLTFGLCLLVFSLAIVAGRAIPGSTPGRRMSFVYVAGMKNTGAGLVLATSVLHLSPLAVIVPVFYTIAQHLAAACCDRLCRGSRAVAVNPHGVCPAVCNNPPVLSETR